ncbi:hypothetical protein Tsp_00510 [Trichinella spiralis]|uniref:hypothetical protein n=1 Tax=Trichinella spiralis TaxID=6334 RepID=UPI0001EFBA72|nr:hypothetical protein Tsp_00510 [Trichinella spiralis]
MNQHQAQNSTGQMYRLSVARVQPGDNRHHEQTINQAETEIQQAASTDEQSVLDQHDHVVDFEKVVHTPLIGYCGTEKMQQQVRGQKADEHKVRYIIHAADQQLGQREQQTANCWGDEKQMGAGFQTGQPCGLFDFRNRIKILFRIRTGEPCPNGGHFEKQSEREAQHRWHVHADRDVAIRAGQDVEEERLVQDFLQIVQAAQRAFNNTAERKQRFG